MPVITSLAGTEAAIDGVALSDSQGAILCCDGLDPDPTGRNMTQEPGAQGHGLTV